MEQSGTRRASVQLSVDVVDVRSADDDNVDSTGAGSLDRVSDRSGIGLPIGNGGPVPVEDDRLEPSPENGRQ
jgi:hypothetical protein